jgi:preprotein translocase subunit SecG
MHLFITILHVLLCISLMLVILLQPAKDGSALLGGGVNSMYGPRANAHPLGRATTVIAAMFMITSVILAYDSTQKSADESDVNKEIEKLQQEREATTPKDETPAPLDMQAPSDAPPSDAQPSDAAPTDQSPPTDAAPATGAAAPQEGGAAPAAPAAPATPAAPAKGQTP